MSILGGTWAGVADFFWLALLLCIFTVVAYCAPALWGTMLGVGRARRWLIAAWLLHASTIALFFFGSHPTRFGFAGALSVTVWLMLAVYIFESHRYPQMRALRPNLKMRWLLAVPASLVVILAGIFPGEPLPESTSPLLPLHGALGIAAYGLFAAAVVHGLVLSSTDTQMRQAGPLSAEPAGGLPLLTQERLMFGFVWAGFALLTLTLIAGALFGEQLYGSTYRAWRWDHKRVFTLLSWLIFAALLLGRWRLGWRGRKAIRVLYVGAACLLLGYAGSRFVLEVLLHRLP